MPNSKDSTTLTSIKVPNSLINKVLDISTERKKEKQEKANISEIYIQLIELGLQLLDDQAKIK